MTNSKIDIGLMVDADYMIIERRKLRLYGAICTWDYTLPLRNARIERCDGTGTWLLSRTEFLKWKNDTQKAGLWLRSPSRFFDLMKNVLYSKLTQGSWLWKVNSNVCPPPNSTLFLLPTSPSSFHPPFYLSHLFPMYISASIQSAFWLPHHSPPTEASHEY